MVFVDVPLPNVLTCTSQERLWKAQDDRPFFESADPIDVSLYSDIIAGIARFLPEDDHLRVLHECLEPDRSDAVKLVGIKALITLCHQVGIPRLFVFANHRISKASKWSHLEPIRTPTLIERVRLLYQVSRVYYCLDNKTENATKSCVSLYNEKDVLGVVKRSAPKPVVKRFSSEAITDRELVILAILCLYRVYPFFFPIDSASTDTQEWFEDVCALVRDPGNVILPLASLRTYHCQAQWMMSHAPGSQYHEMITFWIGMSM